MRRWKHPDCKVDRRRLRPGTVVRIERRHVTLVRSLGRSIEGGWFTSPGPDGLRYWHESDVTSIVMGAKRNV
jgi:hypothetical protein